MGRRRIYIASVGLVLVAAVTLALLFGVLGSQPQEPTANEANLASAEGGLESIQVHGHWIIEVKEPDGRLVSSHEFMNRLGNTADGELSQLLVRDSTAGQWTVTLWNSDPNQNPFLDGASNRSSGHLYESNYSGENPNIFRTLTVSAPTSGINARKLVLSGTATAGADGAINEVMTVLLECLPNVAPSACTYANSSGGQTFTYTYPDITPVPVITGQQILVTVVISFQ